MTRLLASVSGPEEAAVALAGGADLIDLKNPADGPMGAVPPDVLEATVAAVGGRSEVGAVAGNLPFTPEAVLPAVVAMSEAGADWVKLGLFPGGAPAATFAALRPLAERVRLVAVLFADRDPDFALLPEIAASGFAAVMLDTADKGAGRLLTLCDLPYLARFAAACRARDLACGFAGRLQPPDVPRLLRLRPDVLGFRSVLCPRGRAGPIVAARVRLIRALIPPDDAPAAAGAADRRRPARVQAPEAAGPTDCVFVRGLVLPVRIGVYAHEHDAPQRVRFDVSVRVARPVADGRLLPLRDLRDIYSYDIISDGIRMLIASGHVDLVERLAERIAALLLDDPRVVAAEVTVTKLETGSGEVGVSITRSRDLPPAP